MCCEAQHQLLQSEAGLTFEPKNGALPPLTGGSAATDGRQEFKNYRKSLMPSMFEMCFCGGVVNSLMRVTLLLMLNWPIQI